MKSLITNRFIFRICVALAMVIIITTCISPNLVYAAAEVVWKGDKPYTEIVRHDAEYEKYYFLECNGCDKVWSGPNATVNGYEFYEAWQLHRDEEWANGSKGHGSYKTYTKNVKVKDSWDEEVKHPASGYWICTGCDTKLGTDYNNGKAPAHTCKKPSKCDVSVLYKTHVQSYGWQDYVSDGAMSGTSGEAKRLEGINIKLTGNKNVGVRYTTHVQSYGWQSWSCNDEMSGTSGEAKRLEAIEIRLFGKDKDKYDIYYRVHAQSYGWLGWAKNGQPSGTAGLSKRLEGIQIQVVNKGDPINKTVGGITSAYSSAYIDASGSSTNIPNVSNVNVKYTTHVQTYGWQGYNYNGNISGTMGQAKRLEGIKIELANNSLGGNIVYTTHVQTFGWQGNVNNKATWRKNGEMAGTSGLAKRLEAICIDLTGNVSKKYDVYYRVHVQTYGWLGWAKNGQPSGTSGKAKRLEGIQIMLVKKGDKPPVSSGMPAYIR